MSGIGSHHGPVAGKDEWLTPPEIIKSLGEFDLDPCAPIIRPWATAKNHFTIQDNGLRKEWHGRVWCNPPYGKEVKDWCKKALEQSKKGTTTVLLIPCKTNTNWWHDTVIPFAEVRFLRGRVKFVYPDGQQSTQALPWPLAFVIYRPKSNFNPMGLIAKCKRCKGSGVEPKTSFLNGA